MAIARSDYVGFLRDFLKDLAANNILLKFQQENTDDLLGLYLDMALSGLNATPPPVANYQYSNFPFSATLLHKAALECLLSNDIKKSRNDLTYSDGGITVNDGPKYQYIIQVLQVMVKQEEDFWRQFLINTNINLGWGGVSSPYANLHALNYTNIKTFLSVGF
jgi:hypothetical protein